MKITLRSAKLGLVTMEGDVKTLADVKGLFAESGIDFSNVEFVDRQTKHSYRIDDAKIPNVEEILFLLIPVKNKSGVELSDVDVNKTLELGYNDIRSLGSKLNKENNAELDLSGTTPQIRKRVVDFLISNAEVNNTDEDLFEEAKNQMNAIIDQLKAQAKPQIVEKLVVTVMGITEEELDSEVNSIQKGLK